MDFRPFQDLLERKMDRKEFLAQTGAILLAVCGISGLLKIFSDANRQTAGYGAGSYGGNSQPAALKRPKRSPIQLG